MLDSIRRNSWATKGFLGALALMFILFFGSETIRRGDGFNRGAPAKVNGVSINGAKADYLAEDQVEMYRSYFKGNVPEGFLQSVRAQVVESLINRELLLQEATRLGVSATPTEVAQYVKTQPQFQQDGQFSKALYDQHDGYRLAYRQRMGTSYTADITTDLSLKKLTEAFADILSPTPEELRWIYTVQNSQREFSVVRIDKDQAPTPDATNKDAALSAMPPKETAEFIQALWKKGGDIDLALKDKSLSVHKTGPLPLSRLDAVVDGSDNPQILKTLLSLTPENPLPAAPLEEKNFYYVVKLDALKTPDPKELETKQADLKSQYQEQMAQRLQTVLLQDLRRRADIKVNY